MGVRSPLPSPKQCRRKWGKMEAGADRHTPADWPRTEDLKNPSRTASFLLFPLSPRASFVMHPAHCSSTLPIHTRGTAGREERPGNNKRICASNSFHLVFFCTGGLVGTICFVPRTISEYKVRRRKEGTIKNHQLSVNVRKSAKDVVRGQTSEINFQSYVCASLSYAQFELTVYLGHFRPVGRYMTDRPTWLSTGPDRTQISQSEPDLVGYIDKLLLPHTKQCLSKRVSRGMMMQR